MAARLGAPRLTTILGKVDLAKTVSSGLPASRFQALDYKAFAEGKAIVCEETGGREEG
jgi:hypothetical protein